MFLESLKGLVRYKECLEAYTSPEVCVEIIDTQDRTRMRIVQLLIDMADLVGPRLALQRSPGFEARLDDWRTRFLRLIRSALLPEQFLHVNQICDRSMFGWEIDAALEKAPEVLYERVGIKKDISEDLRTISSQAIGMMRVCGTKSMKKLAKMNMSALKKAETNMKTIAISGREVMTNLSPEAIMRLDLSGDLEKQFSRRWELIEKYMNILLAGGKFREDEVMNFAVLAAKNFQIASSHKHNCDDPSVWTDIRELGVG